MRRQMMRMRFLVTLFTLAAIGYAVKTRQSHGTFMGVPFEFRPPTLSRMRQRWWNPDDPRILTPHVFGVGWSVNLYQLWDRVKSATDR